MQHGKTPGQAQVGASWLVIGGTEADLLGRAERSSPEAAERRAAGAGLDGEERAPAIMIIAAMRALLSG